MTHTPHPRRVQVTGDMYHPNIPARAHWAGRQRPHLPKSPFANPHPVDTPGRKTPCPECGLRHTLAEALSLYRQHLNQNPDLPVLAATDYPDTPFACRCPLDQPCHVDELLTRADQTTVIELGDDRDTRYVVQITPVSTGECSHGNDTCPRPGAIAVRNTITQQHPAEGTSLRVTYCADHQAAAPRLRAVWEADAREMQDPFKRAAYLASAGVTT
ncbi:DUF4326 domain-containing protein [Streptomyces sp. S07_1.15]|uniref:DUF4326 domain-containing protein n=1 Tax=Streptomyces sp. S07_1.15 TaxID=2873925 RepID=UPI001D143794|nr:DUF4326 domain-containing protein [Streptomyces sp. S07_1.15]MCC3652729.1 DUF4326 domain-containing protein [Streptomyces sp. S07_1.15]